MTALEVVMGYMASNPPPTLYYQNTIAINLATKCCNETLLYVTQWLQVEFE